MARHSRRGTRVDARRSIMTMTCRGTRVFCVRTSTVTVADQSPTQEPVQNFGTEGIKPLERPSLDRRGLSWPRRLRRAAQSVVQQGRQPADLRQRGVSLDREHRARMARHPRRTRPRAHAQGRSARLPRDRQPTSRAISQDRGWKTFFLSGYGFRSATNIKLCPQHLGRMSEHSRPDHGDVLDPRAGQASAAASRPL